MNQPSTFISAQALSAKLERADVVVLDASWYLPGDPRDPQQEYLDQHIPDARFFGIDAIAGCVRSSPAHSESVDRHRIMSFAGRASVCPSAHKALKATKYMRFVPKLLRSDEFEKQ